MRQISSGEGCCNPQLLQVSTASATSLSASAKLSDHGGHKQTNPHAGKIRRPQFWTHAVVRARMWRRVRRCRPPPPVVQERRERAAKARRNRGALRARPRAARITREVSASKHSPSGARRYEGWHATRACFFTPKTCHYAPLRNDVPRRDDAPPHHPPLVPLAIASITPSASAVSPRPGPTRRRGGGGALYRRRRGGELRASVLKRDE
jgi:hypothetical protein